METKISRQCLKRVGEDRVLNRKNIIYQKHALKKFAAGFLLRNGQMLVCNQPRGIFCRLDTAVFYLLVFFIHATSWLLSHLFFLSYKSNPEIVMNMDFDTLIHFLWPRMRDPNSPI